MPTSDLGGGAHISWAHPRDLEPQRERALDLLSLVERERLDSTPSITAAEGFLWGRMLLRDLVAHLTDAVPAAVIVTARCPHCGGPHGRPSVNGPTGRMSVSVSHSADMVAVAAAWDAAVGVDVEPLAGATDRISAIRSVAGDSADPLRHWTRVEAALKADGRGLRVDPRTVRIQGGQAHITHASNEQRSYRLIEPDLDGYRLSVAVGTWSSAAVPAAQA